MFHNRWRHTHITIHKEKISCLTTRGRHIKKCFKNLPKSLAEKHQRRICYQMLGESMVRESTFFLYAGDNTLEGDSISVAEDYPNLKPDLTQICITSGIDTPRPFTV